MVEVWATIQNEAGIHCRPSAEIVKVARTFPGEISVSCGDLRCDPRSVLALMAMGLARGTRVKITVSGDGEEAFARKLVELFERRYDFPPRKEGEAVVIPPELR